MGEKLNSEEKIKLSRQISGMEPLKKSSFMLEAAFDSNPSWIEVLHVENSLSVRRLRAFKQDGSGGMGKREEAHLIGVAEVISDNTKTYIMEANYPYANPKFSYFFEFYPATHTLNLSYENENENSGIDVSEIREQQTIVFPFLCREMFFNLNFESIHKIVKEHPFKHPYFKELKKGF